ncbi:MAG: tetratricopeptide repeat protein [Blastomonas sp.]
MHVTGARAEHRMTGHGKIALIALLAIAPGLLSPLAAQTDGAAEASSADILYEEGDGFYEAGDLARARSSFSRACAMGHVPACDIYGLMTMHGEGGAMDKELASSAFRQSCSAGSPDGCILLGGLYLGNDAPPASADRARAIFEQGCADGMAVACTHFGLFLLDGMGGDEQRDRGIGLIKTSCNSGEDIACEILNGKGE